MASTINSATSGVVITSDATGALDIQVGGTNAIQISSAANVSVPNLSATSANITTLTGTTISATNMGAQATTQFQAASANITTLTGTNFSATSLTLTNALAVASGGSGRASTTAYAVICGGTTSTGPEQSIASVGTSGQVLTSNGAGALPTFQTAAGLPTMNIVTGTTQAAVTANQYVLTNVAATTVTLPASPAAGATVYVTVANGLLTNVVARNGSNIQSLAEDMTLNAKYASVQLRYADATRGWVLT